MIAELAKTIDFVKKELAQGEAGHDWFHVERVWKTAKHIARQEQVNVLVVELASLLHDIADSKFNGGNEEIGPRKAFEFLKSIGAADDIALHVYQIIKYMSFKSQFEKVPFSSMELKVVQDADRLDAIGAIGIARAFHYGGYKNRAMYDPDVALNLNLTKEAYKNTTAPTINHFYEKLLLLKDLMNTETGKLLAAQRHQFMDVFLQQFYEEWNGKK